MGKEGELWDDSALIKAFDHAISEYKSMHGMSGQKGINESLPAAKADNGSNEFCSSPEHVQDEDNPYTAQDTTMEIGEATKTLQSNEELGSSSNCVGSSNIQQDNVLSTNGVPAAKSGPVGTHMISSDIKSQNEAIPSSTDPEEYSKLLDKYYELEDQRQQIIQQLNQYSNWNYQYPISSTSTAEEHQAFVQPYNTVTCHCPYGCQNWVVPCNSLPATCSGGTCVDKSCPAIPEGSQNGNFMSPEAPDFVKTAMDAAQKALSLTKEANGGKDEQRGMETGHFAESKSATDLDVVLNAWYSAGFYTGKYLSEQSSKSRMHGQGL